MAVSESDGTKNAYNLRRDSRRSDVPDKRPNPWMRRLMVGACLLTVAALIGGGWGVWYYVTFVPTLTARVNATVVELTPRVAALLLEVAVIERDVVEVGQVLARLDDREFVAALRAAQADLAIQQAVLAERKAREALARSRFEADVAVAEAGVTVAEAEVTGLAANLDASRQQLPEQIREAAASLAQREAELARLQMGPRSEEVASARERIASAKATLALYELEVKQSRELVDEGIDSQYILEVRKTRLQTQQHTLKQAELALELLQSGPRPEDLQAAKEAVERERAALAQVKLGEWQVAKLACDVEIRKARLLEAKTLLKQAQARAADVLVAEQQTQGAEAEVRRVQALVEGREAALADMEIRSPVAGMVTRVYGDVGEMCRPGESLILVRDSSRARWIDAFVDEEDAALVSIGQKAMMHVPANSFDKIETKVTQISLHTATLDGGAAAPATAFNEADRVWVKLVPVLPLDVSTVTGTTARGHIKVR